ncbi:MAG: copper chaperone PCu(A)C [Burkholderiales bacterium]|nr:copper chaperone PCu(A)C [Burkholderiales bacterium]
MLRSIVFLAVLAFSKVAFAQSFTVGDLRVYHPAARPTVPAQPSGAVYLKIENNGKQNDRFIAAESPVAASTQIHTMSMDGNVMKMREVDGIDLAPGTKVEMRKGHGYHIMLMGLKNPLKTGDKFPLTLTFQKAGKIETSVVVEANAGGSNKPEEHKH